MNIVRAACLNAVVENDRFCPQSSLEFSDQIFYLWQAWNSVLSVSEREAALLFRTSPEACLLFLLGDGAKKID